MPLFLYNAHMTETSKLPGSMGVGTEDQHLTETGNSLAVVIPETKTRSIYFCSETSLKDVKVFSCPCITQSLVDLSES